MPIERPDDTFIVTVSFDLPLPTSSTIPRLDAGATGARLERVINRSPTNYVRPDMLIVDDIVRALAYAAQIDCSRLEVMCEKGRLVASGVVRSRSERLLIEEIVANTVGDTDYQDNLEVSLRVAPVIKEEDGLAVEVVNQAHPSHEQAEV